jgi:hypothetical protein
MEYKKASRIIRRLFYVLSVISFRGFIRLSCHY